MVNHVHYKADCYLLLWSCKLTSSNEIAESEDIGEGTRYLPIVRPSLFLCLLLTVIRRTNYDKKKFHESKKSLLPTGIEKKLMNVVHRTSLTASFLGIIVVEVAYSVYLSSADGIRRCCILG